MRHIMREGREKSGHAKPGYYSTIYQPIKEIAYLFGYHLVIHGSMSNDMDLLAIPWEEEIKPEMQMLVAIKEYLGGEFQGYSEENPKKVMCLDRPHGRKVYSINLNRGDFKDSDPGYYLDISVMPTDRSNDG